MGYIDKFNQFRQSTDVLYYAAHIGYYFGAKLVGGLRAIIAIYYLGVHFFKSASYANLAKEATRLNALRNPGKVHIGGKVKDIKSEAKKMEKLFSSHPPEEIGKYWGIQLIRAVTEIFVSRIAVFIWVLKDIRCDEDRFYNICDVEGFLGAWEWQQAVANWSTLVDASKKTPVSPPKLSPAYVMLKS